MRGWTSPKLVQRGSHGDLRLFDEDGGGVLVCAVYVCLHYLLLLLEQTPQPQFYQEFLHCLCCLCGKEIDLACQGKIWSSDLLCFDLLEDLHGCSVYLCLGFGGEVATVRMGFVGGIPPQDALLLPLNLSWPAGPKDAAVVAAVKALAGSLSWCE